MAQAMHGRREDGSDVAEWKKEEEEVEEEKEGLGDVGVVLRNFMFVCLCVCWLLVEKAGVSDGCSDDDNGFSVGGGGRGRRWATMVIGWVHRIEKARREAETYVYTTAGEMHSAK